LKCASNYFENSWETLSFSLSSSCVLLHEDGSVIVLFLSIRAVVMGAALAENFEMRFSGFRSHVTNIRRPVFESELFTEVSGAPKKFQLQLTHFCSVVSANKLQLFFMLL
jgi:hypothetical protein